MASVNLRIRPFRPSIFHLNPYDNNKTHTKSPVGCSLRTVAVFLVVISAQAQNLFVAGRGEILEITPGGIQTSFCFWVE